MNVIRGLISERRLALSKRLRYWGLWSLICAAVLILCFWGVLYTENREFRQAAEWHKAHGNMILIDGHKLNLPQDWWEESEDEIGKYVVAKASRNLIGTSSTGIVIERKGLEESKASENEIRKTLESFVENENRGNHAPIASMVAVQAVSTNIYCMRTLIDGENIKLRCDVVGTPIVISSVGPLGTEKEIEAIISTFE